jgi:hypothetical protein
MSTSDVTSTDDACGIHLRGANARQGPGSYASKSSRRAGVEKTSESHDWHAPRQYRMRSMPSFNFLCWSYACRAASAGTSPSGAGGIRAGRGPPRCRSVQCHATATCNGTRERRHLQLAIAHDLQAPLTRSRRSRRCTGFDQHHGIWIDVLADRRVDLLECQGLDRLRILIEPLQIVATLYRLHDRYGDALAAGEINLIRADETAFALRELGQFAHPRRATGFRRGRT